MSQSDPDRTSRGGVSPGFKPSDYLSGSRIEFGALARTSAVAFVLAIAAWFADVLSSFYAALGSAFRVILGAIGWLISFPFDRWPGYLSDAFDSASVFFEGTGLGGFVLGTLFVSAFVIFASRLVGRVITSVGGGS